MQCPNGRPSVAVLVCTGASSSPRCGHATRYSRSARRRRCVRVRIPFSGSWGLLTTLPREGRGALASTTDTETARATTAVLGSTAAGRGSAETCHFCPANLDSCSPGMGSNLGADPLGRPAALSSNYRMATMSCKATCRGTSSVHGSACPLSDHANRSGCKFPKAASRSCGCRRANCPKHRFAPSKWHPWQHLHSKRRRAPSHRRVRQLEACGC
mmetsp:Transcript_44334/g.128956  ORF Transcript_44334/g.128956 Transcript_44334/m.128956 type:complete len:214 (+) Transcript_44334:191-832(+)